MKKIDYSYMTSSGFQTFCNVLLWLEFGDAFIGYEAPGRDGGIDGEYEGKYKKESGKWRFQYKFHKTARKAAVNSIRTDLAGEINKLGYEDHLVLLSNVALNPNERKNLSGCAKNLLIKAGKAKVQFKLWDEGILQRLVLQYPLIQQWIDPTTSGIFLLPYQKAFARQLNAAPNALETFANTFISRHVELNVLLEFFENNDSSLFIIKGEAGIGKTRLAIEFLKKMVDINQGWRTLAINQYSLDINSLTTALNGAQNYVVLVDDAHKLSPALLADIRGLGGKRGKYITKFVFTMRSLESYNAMKLISPLNDIPSMTLDKLSLEATRELFSQELSGTYLRHYIDELVLISGGRPILIVGLLQAFRSGKKVTGVKTNKGFSEYVLQYFDSFLDRFVQRTGLPLLKAKNLLQLCCLLEPFSYNDTGLIHTISVQENIEEEFVEGFLSALAETGLSGGHQKQAIRPDYYSDVYLQQHTTQQWVTKKMTQYKELQSNILINLASIDEVENGDPKQLNSLLNQSLQEYLGELRIVTNTAAITERMDLAASIAFQKPGIAIAAVQDFIWVISDPTHFLGTAQQQYSGQNYNPNSKLFAFAKKVLRDVLFYTDYYEAAYHLLLDLHKCTGEKDLFKGTFSFDHPTFLQQNSIKAQHFFVEKCRLLIPVADDKQALFVLDCLEALLKLRFDTSKWDLIKRDSISFQTYYLPKNEVIEKLRLNIMAVLIDCYRQHQAVAVRFKVLNLILDIPREISAHKSSPSHYESDTEIGQLLDFIEAEVDRVPVAFRKELLNELFWYKKGRVNPKYYPRIAVISERLKPKTLTEKMIQYLLVLEQEYVRSITKTKYETDFKKLMLEYTPEAMADSLGEIWSSSLSPFWYFAQPVEMVCRQDLPYTKAVYLRMKEKNRAFVNYYGYLFLRRLRCDEHQDHSFQAEIAAYMAGGSDKELQVVLEVYSNHAANSLILNAYDKEIIVTIFLQRTEGLGVFMASTLVLFYKQDPVVALSYIEGFLQDCNQVSASQLYWQLEDEIISNHQLAALLLEMSVRFGIDHNVEKALTLIGKGSMPKTLFNAFIKRYERKKLVHNTAEGGYSLVPTGERDFFSEGFDDDYRLALYRLGLQWFVHVNGDWFADLYSEQLLEYLRPDLVFTLPCAALYVQVGVEKKHDYPALLRLIESLKMYHSKTPLLIHTLSFLLHIANKAHPGSRPFLQDVYAIGNQVLTCVGGKHGTVGQPFECDVELRELFLEEQPNYSGDLMMANLIKYAIEQVDTEIKRQSQDEFAD